MILKKTGTFPLVTKWNIKVPKPAQKIATDVSKPVKIGTKTVAPNIAIRCCKAKITLEKLAISSLAITLP